jgi:hypothetical protein
MTYLRAKLQPLQKSAPAHQGFVLRKIRVFEPQYRPRQTSAQKKLALNFGVALEIPSHVVYKSSGNMRARSPAQHTPRLAYVCLGVFGAHLLIDDVML